MIHPERIQRLNDRTPNQKGRYALYWMQHSQRTIDNHALEYAAEQAAAVKRPLVVWFGLTPNYPDANARHFFFLFQGLRDVAADLSKRGIPFRVEIADPGEGILKAGAEAVLVVTDRGYLNHQREWRRAAAEALNCPLIQVESDVIVPVNTASDKEEYAAATIRKKIRNHLPAFLKPLRSNHRWKSVSDEGVAVPQAGKRIDAASLTDEAIERIIAENGIDTSVPPVSWITGGQIEAGSFLKSFLGGTIATYDSLRNDPSKAIQSNLSPYFHFGHLSPLTAVLKLLAHEAKEGRYPISAAAPGEFRVEALSPGAQAFIEELVVRRELSANFCHFNTRYDTLEALPTWAQETLSSHQKDRRPYLYSLKELEEGRTRDPYWNAASREMVRRGKMHGYMRMYWGKKIIEWTPDAATAHSTMVYLNNRYFLDGRDMNGYTGIAWCFGKHDRPWKEREIFGKVRYMNARGLERKFDIKKYTAQMEKLS